MDSPLELSLEKSPGSGFLVSVTVSFVEHEAKK